MEYENKYASKGVAGTGLGLAIGALGLNALGGGLGNLLGGGNCADKDIEIAYLRGRDAAKTDSLELYKYVDGRFRNVEAEIANQAVKNAQIEGTFAVLGEQSKALRNEFMCALNREKDERCCGDSSIVTYLNATFYPKQVADVTIGTTSTPQPTYNPVYNCGCGCNH
jgi:hypothetical protein